MSSLIITNGKILVGKEYIDGNLEIMNGVISRIGDFQVDRNKLKVIDANGQVVVPGFIDIHTHGGNGIDINHASKDDLNKLSKFFASCGVTSFLPAILTDTHETMCKLLSEKSDEIDAMINKYAKNWSVNRMAKVDLAILRLAICEILFVEEIPNKVSINEAIEMAKLYCDDKTPKFINGILGSVVSETESK